MRHNIGHSSPVYFFREHPLFWSLFSRISIETKSDEETKDVIIQLSQRDSRSLLMDNKETLIIGFTVLKVEFNRKYRLHQFSEEQIVNKSDYIKSKHIFLRANLPRGRYVIVVTTFEPGQSTDFLLRVFTEEDPDLKCLTKDVPTLKWYQFWQSPPKIVTRLTIKSASGLEKRDIFGSKYSPTRDLSRDNWIKEFIKWK